MEKTEYSQPIHSPVFQITAIWTICFLLGPLIGLAIGQAFMPSLTEYYGSWTFMLFGLVIAESMSGLFTALILRRRLPQMKIHHIILLMLGWGVAGLISWYVLFNMGATFD